jgi:hypothetical protein
MCSSKYIVLAFNILATIAAAPNPLPAGGSVTESQPCFSETDCITGLFCQGGSCIKPGEYSLDVGGSCAITIMACNWGLVCPAGVCEVPAAGSLVAGASCQRNPQGCQAGLTCQNNMCVAVVAGAPADYSVDLKGDCSTNTNACKTDMTCQGGICITVNVQKGNGCDEVSSFCDSSAQLKCVNSICINTA